jgi:hypothetical protein
MTSRSRFAAAPFPRCQALTAAAVLFAACAAAPRALDTPPWRSREIGEGVVWHRVVRTELRGVRQTVHVLEIDPAKNEAMCKLVAWSPRARVSSLGTGTEALAAVNGGYFDGEGKPVGFLRIDARDIAGPAATKPARGAVGLGGEGGLDFRRLGAGDAWEGPRDAIGAGPILVEAGVVKRDFAVEGFTDAKFLGANPRTAIGETAEGRILLVTVDGRQAGAAGMSLDELAGLMASLGCRDALNLDGGGSTTCWIRGRGTGGVVNSPSDLTGERPVANAVAVVAPRVYIVDDEPGDTDGLDAAPGRFRAVGEHAFTSSAASGSYGKGCAFGMGPARGEWTVRVEARGRYEVFARWPRGHWTTVAEYTLVGLTEPVVVRVSQVGGAGEWFPLGFVEADAATPIRVEVTSCTRDPVAADAIRVVERRGAY